MQDADDSLARIDLTAWEPPAPPAGLADAVIARLREPAAVSAVDPSERRPRRAWWIAGLAIGAAAVAAIATWGVARSPGRGHGEVITARPRHLQLDGSSADLDAGAEVRWQRDQGRITAQQTRGNVQWTIEGGDTLVLAPGGPGSTATIEASGASLRVEVTMNLSDIRVLGASSVTAAAVALVSVTVYEGHVRATSGGQTVRIEPGATVELRPAAPPRLKASPEPPSVGASVESGELAALRARIAEKEKRVAELEAQLAEPTIEGEEPAPANVAPNELEANRVSGSRSILPSPGDRIAIALSGQSKVIGTFKLCVDASGRISSLKTLKSTGMERYDQTIVEGIRGWEFRPFVIDDAPSPVCTVATFVYPGGNTEPSQQTPRTVRRDESPAANERCAVMNIEDLLTQAQNQFGAGYARSALSLVKKTLECRQDVRLFRLAAVYACAARDLATAKAMFQKVPAQYQKAIEQRCQLEGIDIRGR